MPATVVVGAQWGDEGKAKIIDILSQRADAVVRYQGGCNAGHTVVHNGQVFKFHLIPSGILYPGKACVIGTGTVILPTTLEDEIQILKGHGVDVSNLLISERAHVTLPFHMAMDKAKEEFLGASQIGTTLRGIGPTMEDKVGRIGLRVGDFFQPEDVLLKKIEHIAMLKNPILTKMYNLQPINPEELLALCLQDREIFAPYVTNTDIWLANALSNNKHILLEGAQGTMLDLDHGTYPYVTSSNPSAGGACAGAGISPTAIKHIVGVVKAYTTRVGGGPYPTELFDESGAHIAKVGNEFGTTTGRPRRCGWFDAVAMRYSTMVNGYTEIALTKLDVLSGLPKVAICVAYRHKVTQEQIYHFPAASTVLDEVEPVYEWFEGWSEPIDHINKFEQLPPAAQTFVTRLASHIGVPIRMISVGVERAQTILVKANNTEPVPA